MTLKEYNGRVVKQIDIDCLSDIPNDNRYCYVVELPMFILHYTNNLKKVDVIVSDFSEICNSVLAGNSIKANSMPRQFDLLQNSTYLPKSQLFYILVNNLLDENLLKSRCNVKDNCPQFPLFHRGILLMARVYINIALDGVYGELISWTPLNSSHLHTKSCRDFVKRYHEHVTKQIFRLSNTYHDIESVITPAPTIKQENQPLLGAQLLFHKIEEDEDSQAPLYPPTQPNDLYNDHQDSSLEVQDKATSQVEDTNIFASNDKAATDIDDNNASNSLEIAKGNHLQVVDTIIQTSDIFFIQRTSIEHILNLSIPKEISKDQIYQVSANIKGYIPYSPFIIKPFKRTVKFANFKLVVEQDGRQLFLEFHLEKQICKFLQLDEPEEIFNDFKEVETKLQTLLNNEKPVNINIKLQSKHIKNGRIYPYWACISTIDELLGP